MSHFESHRISYAIFMNCVLVLAEHIFKGYHFLFFKKKPRLYQKKYYLNHRINWFETRKIQKNSYRYIDTGQLGIWKKKTYFFLSANFLQISLNALLAIFFKSLQKRLISFLFFLQK